MQVIYKSLRQSKAYFSQNKENRFGAKVSGVEMTGHAIKKQRKSLKR